MNPAIPTHQIHYRGRYIQVALASVPRADGTFIQRDVVLHPGAVAILPVLDAEHLCLIRNHRLSVGERLLEIPAGTLEPGEAPEKAAVRELAEETGYQAGRWRKLSEFYPSPGVLSEKTHLFVAQDLSGGQMDLEDDEDLEPLVVSWDEALRWVSDGSIRDAKTIIAVLLWARLRE